MKNLLIILFSVFSFLSFTLNAHFSPPPFSKNDFKPLPRKLQHFLNSIQNLYAAGRLDGEVLVAQGSKEVLHLKSANVATQGANPQFMIGSISKQFFAVALLKALYEKAQAADKIGEVKKMLHEPLSLFLPKEAEIWSGKMPAWANEVTLHQLLTHTSGVQNFFDGFASATSEEEIAFFEHQHKKSEIFQTVAQEPLLFKPGTHFAYSNTGYLLISEILEKLTQMPSNEYLQKTLFGPVALQNTSSADHGQWRKLKSEKSFSHLVSQLNYDPRNTQYIYAPKHSEDLSIAVGSASIISTASDLLKWNIALHKMKTVLPADLYNLLIQPRLENYGYGVGISHTDLGPMIGHQGTIGTYRSYLIYLPMYDVSIVILTHINYDFKQIQAEGNLLEKSFKNQGLNDQESGERTSALMDQKYPGTRGFDQIEKMLAGLFRPGR